MTKVLDRNQRGNDNANHIAYSTPTADQELETVECMLTRITETKPVVAKPHRFWNTLAPISAKFTASDPGQRGQVLQMIALGGVLILAGTAMAFVKDFNGAGWYVLGAGLVAIAFGSWFLLRGGNVPHPPANLPKPPPPAPLAATCPHCLATDSRPMTAVETTAFYGYDRFVFKRPRICSICNTGYEPKTPRLASLLMIGVGAVGMLIGVAFLLGGPFGVWMGWHDAAMAASQRFKCVAGGIVMLPVGVWWIRRSLLVAYGYYGRLER
ncbi:hypothetical protein BH10PLA2_BH10PLA2_25150 [soil metagenome]